MATVATLSKQHTAANKLCKLFGINGPVRRMVIDIPANGIAVVYVQRFIQTDEFEAMANIVEPCSVVEATELSVGVDGTVKAK